MFPQRWETWTRRLAIVALAAVYIPGLVALVSTWWTDPNTSHGFVVVAISAWLAWTRRAALRDAAGEPSRAGLALVALGLALYVLGVWAEVNFLPAVSLIISLVGVTAQFWGWRVVRQAWFCYAFLLFMVPWPDLLVEFLSFPMQLMSATYAVMIVGILGVPVHRTGVEISLKNYTFEVAIPCSGMRSLVALMALAALMAYFWHGPLARRLLLFVIGTPVALLANALRIACVLLIAANWGPKAAEGFFHGFSGVVVFVFAVVGLAVAGRAMGLGRARPAPA